VFRWLAAGSPPASGGRCRADRGWAAAAPSTSACGGSWAVYGSQNGAALAEAHDRIAAAWDRTDPVGPLEAIAAEGLGPPPAAQMLELLRPLLRSRNPPNNMLVAGESLDLNDAIANLRPAEAVLQKGQDQVRLLRISLCCHPPMNLRFQFFRGVDEPVVSPIPTDPLPAMDGNRPGPVCLPEEPEAPGTGGVMGDINGKCSCLMRKANW